jgi:hypothetical protein
MITIKEHKINNKKEKEDIKVALIDLLNLSKYSREYGSDIVTIEILSSTWFPQRPAYDAAIKLWARRQGVVYLGYEHRHHSSYTLRFKLKDSFFSWLQSKNK